MTLGFAGLVGVFSGVWPVLNLSILSYAWFVPMTEERRVMVLRILERSNKWTLVTVYLLLLVRPYNYSLSLPRSLVHSLTLCLHISLPRSLTMPPVRSHTCSATAIASLARRAHSQRALPLATHRWSCVVLSLLLTHTRTNHRCHLHSIADTHTRTDQRCHLN